MSSHASNECRASALSQGETAAPPQGAGPSPWRDTVPACGQRSPRSDLRPPSRCPGRDMSGHTSRGVTRDEALPQRETPPRRGPSAPHCYWLRQLHAELGSRRPSTQGLAPRPRAGASHRRSARRPTSGRWTGQPSEPSYRMLTAAYFGATTTVQGWSPTLAMMKAFHRGATRCLPAALGAYAPTDNHSRSIPEGT